MRRGAKIISLWRGCNPVSGGNWQCWCYSSASELTRHRLQSRRRCVGGTIYYAGLRMHEYMRHRFVLRNEEVCAAPRAKFIRDAPEPGTAWTWLVMDCVVPTEKSRGTEIWPMPSRRRTLRAGATGPETLWKQALQARYQTPVATPSNWPPVTGCFRSSREVLARNHQQLGTRSGQQASKNMSPINTTPLNSQFTVWQGWICWFGCYVGGWQPAACAAKHKPLTRFQPRDPRPTPSDRSSSIPHM